MSEKIYKDGDMVLRWQNGKFVPAEYNSTMKRKYIRGKGDLCFVKNGYGRIDSLYEDKTPGINDGWFAKLFSDDLFFTTHISNLSIVPIPEPVTPPKIKTRVIAIRANYKIDTYGFNGEPDIDRIIDESIVKWKAKEVLVMTTGKEPIRIFNKGFETIKRPSVVIEQNVIVKLKNSKKEIAI